MWKNRWSESKLGCHLDQLISRIQDCIRDLVTWMIHNKLQRNDDETELMLVTPKMFHNHPSTPPSMQINQVDISFSPCVRSFSVVLDQTLSFKQQVLNICRVAYPELRRISTIRHYLSVDTTKTLICAFVLSRIDYCNFLLAGIPHYRLERLKKKKTLRITLHVLSSNLQSIATFPLFFAHCTGFPSPRE